MTVASEVSRITYNGDAVSQAFPVPFYFLVNADLVVLLVSPAGVSVTQVLAADYTVAGAGVLAGGTVNMTVAPPAGYKLIIYRDPAATQLTDYQANDPFPAETHERALDKLTMLVQRLRELASRSLTLSDSDTSATSTRLPLAIAGKILGWAADGLSIVNLDPSAVGAGSIGTTELANNSVTSAKIVDGAIVGADLNDSVVNDLTTVALASADYVMVADASNGFAKRKGLISDIVALVVANIPAASTLVSGILKTSTTALVQAGTDLLTAITPASLLAALGFSAYYQSPLQTITSAGALTLAHGLGREPNSVEAFLQCVTAEAGYTVGQKFPIALSATDAATNIGVSIIPDATNLTIRFGSAAGVFVAVNASTGGVPGLTNANWRVIIRARG